MEKVLNDANFNTLKTIIQKTSGIHFTESNRIILDGRVKERIKELGVTEVGDYLNTLRSDKNEMEHFLDLITTNLTRFFRNTAHFTTLEKIILPQLMEKKQAANDFTLRFWSAGCSTGEEAYSIAMMIDKVASSRFKLSMVASDLSLKSLMIAREGVYPENRMSGVPSEYLKYFEPQGGSYKVKDCIKKSIKFDYHNLKNDSGLRDLDVVFCRNVIIYFDEAAQKEVINKFWRAMSSNSFLFIGHSESLFNMDTEFEFYKTEWTTLYRKKK